MQRLRYVCLKKNLLLAVCMAGVMVSFVSEAFGQSLPVYDTPDRSKIPAFPGADGAGKYTTGGAGGEVLVVNSLKDSATASYAGNTFFRKSEKQLSLPTATSKALKYGTSSFSIQILSEMRFGAFRNS